MKTLQESIIGRKGAPVKFTKNMLKSGYVVQYLNGNFAMYFEYEDAVRITRTRSCLPQMRGEGGFFSISDFADFATLSWMPTRDYNDNLIYFRDNETLNITTVWPVKTYPQLLDQESLEHLTKGVAPIKINQ